jgi:hypothetical protein
MKKLVNGKSQCMPHPKDRSEGIRSETQVGNLAQEFKAMLLGLEWIFFCIRITQYFNGTGYKLNRLTLSL